MNIEEAYASAVHLAKNHYENFPVVSLFVRRELRKHVAAIYYFARTADDMADEGSFQPETRIERLENFEKSFLEALDGSENNIYLCALANTIKEKELSEENFLKLLMAFKQDVVKHRFQDFNEILHYCSHSADPVGRIILELHGIREKQVIDFSDRICTALQLTNFYQDVSRDIKIDRIYVPLDEMRLFGITEEDILEKNYSSEFASLMKKQVDRTADMFSEGKSILPFLKGRLRFQIEWTIAGGEKILDKIRDFDYNVLSNRPKLGSVEKISLMLRSIIRG